MPFRTALFVVVALCAVGPVAGQQARLLGLGFLPGDTGSDALGVSGDGLTVVGRSGTPSRAFRWSLASGIQTVPGLDVAWDVDRDGDTIVGARIPPFPAPVQAMLWTASGGAAPVGMIPPGAFDQSTAYGVSADGATLVGQNAIAALTSQPFLQTPPGAYANLGWLGAGPYGAAHAVSDDGSTAVGYSATHLRSQAFRHTAATGMVPLGQLPGATSSSAHGVNADGSVIVGGARDLIGPRRAWRWTAATGTVDLAAGSGLTDTHAHAVNADGSVVVGTAGSDVAVVWTRVAGMRRLDAVLAGQGAQVAGWQLHEATGVSADGRVIVGLGTNPQGRVEAFAAGLLWPWTDLGHGLGGVAGTPRLSGDGTLRPGSRTVLFLDRARPSSVTALVTGLSPAFVPLLGGTLVPCPDFVAWPLPVDGRGEQVLAFDWPPIPAGSRVWWQHWVLDAAAPFGVAASNGLLGEVLR